MFGLHWVLMERTGDLAALRGLGTFEVNGPLGTGACSGKIHFE